MEYDSSPQWMVLINSEEQYALFPSDQPHPEGWRPAGCAGTKNECVAYVDEHWADMWPKSLRVAMAIESAAS